MTSLACEHDICHKLHLDGNLSGTLTLVAPSSVGIEREILGREAHRLCQGLLCHEFAYGVIRLDVSGRIRTAAFAYRVLVNKLNMLHITDISAEADILAWCVAHLAYVTLEGRVEDAFYKT